MNTAFGRYRLLERLGQGGMAEVFKAKSYGVEGFEKILVIKRILPELAESQSFVDMFVHEAKLSVRLSHANIVQVFDLGIASGQTAPDGRKLADAYYIAMEYVHGFDLATLLQRALRQQAPLPIEMCVFVAAEIAKGLDHAHRRRDEESRPLGIVHRDVSPQNVLVSYEGEVKVTDFGIAKARGVLEEQSLGDTQARKLQGKFGYMSPEQARGEEVDARSDLFSLGTILYECLSGANPFRAPTTFETLRRVQAAEFPPIELLRPEVPKELSAIITSALAREPADRFADAGRMYEALLAFLYAHGRRFFAHDLAEWIAGFRDEDPTTQSPIADPLLDDAHAERTPVEGHARPSLSRFESGGVRYVPIERAAEVGELRDVTALVVVVAARDEAIRSTETARVSSVIERYGGRVLSCEHGVIHSLFGLIEPDGRDTEVAARCALVVLRAIEAASAGLHVGRVHVSGEGEPTADERLSSLIGTAGELARAREGRCALSPSTLKPLKTRFELEPLSESDDQTGAMKNAVVIKDVRAPAEAFGRFVGRKAELRKVGEVLASATRRVPRVLTIRGDHGIGKTRLLYEVERRLRKGNYSVGFHIATCPPRGAAIPLSGIVCMLHVLCGVSEGDSHDRILAVQPRLRALGLQGDEVAAVLATLGANVAPGGGPAKSTLRNAFARMVASLCEDRPHAFAWDVAHSMDEDSFAILSDVFSRLATSRVIFIFAARAGFSHLLERSDAHVSLELADLDLADVERLVALRLGIDAAPDELLRFVRERASGHPLFVEEVLKALVDVGAVTAAEKRVVSMRLVGQELALPKTLRGLVASRVARLDAEVRATLQAAAVLGDPVDARVLSQMLGQPMATIERSLVVLRESRFLVQTGPAELRFASPLVPEVVADAVPPEVLRELHAAAGHALETVYLDRAWEHASRIATNFYEAGDRDRAATYFAKSGERLLDGRQFEAAARDYARAIALCVIDERPAEELAQWFSGLATSVRLVRNLPDGPELCARVLARLDAAGIDPLRVRARVDAGLILGAAHRFDAAEEMFADAERIAGDDPTLRKTVLIACAEQATRQGDFKRTYENLERLQKFVGDKWSLHERHKVFLNLAQAHAGLGNRTKADRALDQAHATLPNDATAACERQKLRGLIEYYARDFRAAAAACEIAIDMSRAAGLAYEVAVNLHNLGDSLIRLADYARAYGAIQQSLALCDEAPFDRLGSLNRMYLTFLDGLAGGVDSEGILRRGIAYAEANDFTWDLLSGRYMLAQLLMRRGLPDAKDEFVALKRLAASSGHRLIEDDCDVALAEIATRAPE